MDCVQGYILQIAYTKNDVLSRSDKSSLQKRTYKYLQVLTGKSQIAKTRCYIMKITQSQMLCLSVLIGGNVRSYCRYVQICLGRCPDLLEEDKTAMSHGIGGEKRQENLKNQKKFRCPSVLEVKFFAIAGKNFMYQMWKISLCPMVLGVKMAMHDTKRLQFRKKRGVLSVFHVRMLSLRLPFFCCFALYVPPYCR